MVCEFISVGGVPFNIESPGCHGNLTWKFRFKDFILLSGVKHLKYLLHVELSFKRLQSNAFHLMKSRFLFFYSCDKFIWKRALERTMQQNVKDNFYFMRHVLV